MGKTGYNLLEWYPREKFKAWISNSKQAAGVVIAQFLHRKEMKINNNARNI